MLTDITLCHGEGNLGRVCMRRQTCQRYVGLKTLMPGQNHSQSQMLCRPNIMLTGDAQIFSGNEYRFYVPVDGDA